MAENMTISVFITSYNQAPFLREAIESVLSQTLPPSEIIIVDDASTDDSRDLISDYKSKYPELIKYKFHKTNEGVARTRVDALNLVNHDFVTYLDGDDRFLPEKLESEFELFRNDKELGIVFSNNVYISEDGKEHISNWIDDEIVPVGEVFKEVFSRRYPKRSLYRMEMIKYELWKKIGFHDTSLKIYEDYDMRIRLTKRLTVAYVNQILSEIRTHNRGLSKTKVTEHLESLESIFYKNYNLLDGLNKKEHASIIKSYLQWYNYNAASGLVRSVKQADLSYMVNVLYKALLFNYRLSKACRTLAKD